MPIKPENRDRYPLDWKQRRQYIIDFRAGRKCEWCGVPQYGVGRRVDGEFILASGSPYIDDLRYSSTFKEAKDLAMQLNAWESTLYPYIVIVLTIAHVHDKNPEACELDNLAALCQRCHLNHDQEDNIRSRRRDPNQMELF